MNSNLTPGNDTPPTMKTDIEPLNAHVNSAHASSTNDRFESARGVATIKWRTADLMAHLRSDD